MLWAMWGEAISDLCMIHFICIVSLKLSVPKLLHPLPPPPVMCFLSVVCHHDCPVLFSDAGTIFLILLYELLNNSVKMQLA